MKAIRRGIRSLSFDSVGSCTRKSDYTAIEIETAAERTPLLVDQWRKRVQYYSIRDIHYNPNNSSEFLSDDDTTAFKTDSTSYKYAKWSCCDLRLMIFIMFLIASFIVAIYLLVIESRLPLMRFSLDLIHHDIWSKVALPLGSILNHSNVLNIVIMHTGGRHCEDSDSCLIVLRAMQQMDHRDMEMPYNFLIGGDGQTYEVRGWDHQSGVTTIPTIPTETAIVIGFIGNYSDTAPSAVQLQSAWSLIKESTRRKKLQDQYKIYCLRNISVSHMDGEALFRPISKWSNFDSLLQVL